jgi:hypothetical protein
MRPRRLEYDPVLFQLINKEPVCFNVTFSASRITSDKLMVTVKRIKPFPLNKYPGNNLELIEILPASSCPLNVSLELPGIDRGSHSDSQPPEHITGVLTNH